jgi:Ca-activated chloride channel homolog
MRRVLVLVVALLSGCSSLSNSSGLGATPGGVKDLRLARDLVKNGKVPPADAVLVEAMFAEHDLPLQGPACERTLCVRAAGGMAPDLSGKQLGFAQIGLSSSIDPDTWQRPATTFIFTVDVSGSMGWGYDTVDRPSAGQLARKALHGLADRLRPDDEVAIVTYGSKANLALPLQTGADPAKVHGTINELREDGSTNMEAGLQLAIDVAKRASRNMDKSIVVFTDEQPNVGATAPSRFELMVRGAASEHAYTSVLGFGMGLGAEVGRAMAAVRGANAFSMTQMGDVDTFLTDDAPYFTTPIAFDLKLTSTCDTGWSVERGFGFPRASDVEPSAELSVSSVFLSKRRGALLLAMAPQGDPDLLAHVALSYTQADGGRVEDNLEVRWARAQRDAQGKGFAQPTVARTTALALLTEAMHSALVDYGSKKEARAEATLEKAHERFVADAATLASPDLGAEVEFSAALLKLVKARAAQGTFY